MMRDLDQIRERDDAREGSKLALIALGGLAAACVLFAAGVLIGREGDASARIARHGDPLARLDALAGEVADAGAPVVTYPDRLVDPPGGDTLALGATALAAAPTLGVATAGLARPGVATVIDSAVRARTAPTLGAAPTGPIVRIVPSARESAPAAAAPEPAVRASGTTAVAPAGSDGAFTLQVSSFRALAAAQAFAQRLREHGHRAFVSSGTAPAGGALWHRVRVGPFASLRDAQRYRADFETRERLPTFVVRQNAEPAHDR